MKSISIFLNSEGITSSPPEAGIIRVYTQNPAVGSWEITKEFAFSLLKSSSLLELRRTILNMVQRIGDCRIFAAREVAGQLYSVLEANNFNIYEVEGKPEQFLDSIIASEEESEKTAGKSTKTPVCYPAKNGIEGSYFIDLKAALNSDSTLTSKKILLPFLESRDFKVLEVICDHIPRWFSEEFERQGLQSTESKLDRNEYKVTISIR